ncbi:cell division protein SepF [Jeotgalibaca caeni]|uniref:cell division protein SepF n=1 Tax=Jeotgalibaca caeni TaxID=3028623 RepID=UPI00237D5434|nr:cell division protein SepF [Jeotgalibaca caeni]MDE1547929.1 cell division protein SepF [Jeotgalibaca caeni]
MSIKDSVRNFFGLDEVQPTDSEYLEADPVVDREQVRSVSKAQTKVIPLNQRHTTPKTSIHVLEPRVYREAEKIAAYLLQSEAVLVNFRRMEADEAAKIIDFLSGTIYAIKGDLQKVGDDIFLCTPAEVTISNLHTSEKRDEYLY